MVFTVASTVDLMQLRLKELWQEGKKNQRRRILSSPTLR